MNRFASRRTAPSGRSRRQRRYTEPCGAAESGRSSAIGSSDVDSLDLLEAITSGPSDPIDGLFPQQRAFFDDPAKLKAALAGRRAGKTWLDCAGLYDAAKKHKRSLNPYIGLSAVAARRIMWPVLKAMNEECRLGLRLHDHELIAELPNGSQIFGVGADDRRKVEALRGPKYGRVVIDEPGSFPRTLLRYLCDDVLSAALMDYDGDMWLTGTPNAACVGHFHDITTGKNPKVARVPTYHWTVLDNVHIPHASEWLKRKRESMGWAIDNPVYLREYMAQWIRDIDSLVFRFDRARHLVKAADVPDAVSGVIGADLGSSDKVASTAFVVNLWAKFTKAVYTMKASKYAGMSPLDGADELERLFKQFPAVSRVMVDEGGLGKGYADEWRRRCQIPVQAAQKRDKLAYVEFLNGELDRGNVKLLDDPATLPLIEELELLQWNEDRDGYDDRFFDHAADAWLYGWRECFAWSEAAAPTAGPAEGTPEWYVQQASKEKAAAMAAANKRARMNIRAGRFG